VNETVRPIEESDPEFSKLLKWYCNNDTPHIDSISIAEPVNITKIGRNDLCPCGSGKKYKKCKCH